ncbi:MAG: hypothetical protein H8K07_01605 [Nitrospira sp.]|nr:hypothetical protein [Nitrospira sp.]
MMKVCAIAMGLLLYVLLRQGWMQALAQEPTAVLPIETDVERWAKLIERVGFCLVGFGILAYMMCRQSALEGITKRYDETQQAHLQAFKDINEAYRVMLKETKDTILLSVQVQSTLLAKVEAMERNYGK